MIVLTSSMTSIIPLVYTYPQRHAKISTKHVLTKGKQMFQNQIITNIIKMMANGIQDEKFDCIVWLSVIHMKAETYWIRIFVEATFPIDILIRKHPHLTKTWHMQLHWKTIRIYRAEHRVGNFEFVDQSIDKT